MIVVQWILSLIFVLQMYVMLALVALVFAPWALFSRKGSEVAIRFLSRWTLTSLRLICGVKQEVRGHVPSGAVLVAAKHQSFLDIFMLLDALGQPRFVMKQELAYVPILGKFAMNIGCIPVARGKKGAALSKMKTDVARVEAAAGPGQLVIYPQGTRVAPGVSAPYKIGVAPLYLQLGQPCVPVATNVGMFWPKRGILRRRGTAVIEFLPMIPAGMKLHAFMEHIEQEIEAASDRLMHEAEAAGVRR